MKWTTANSKNPNYVEDHVIYVGTQTGSFKKLTPYNNDQPFGQTNLRSLESLDETNRVTTLAFGDDQRTEILLGQCNSQVQIYNPMEDRLQRSLRVAQEAPVVGLAHYDNQMAIGFNDGRIQILKLDPEQSDTAEPVFISVGDAMDHLRQCNKQRNLLATGGKERQNNLKVFDLEAGGKQIFSSKNLPNDWLQLEVKVWDSDVGFIDEPHMLATCSRHGYVRVYDTRKQRRPIQCYATEEPQISFSTLTARGNYIYTGSTRGELKAFDIRKMKTFVHTYKGFTGSIYDLCLDESGKYLASASLDRYVRVHHVDSTVMMYQCYVKSKAAQVLIRESFVKNDKGNSEQDSERAGTDLDDRQKAGRDKDDAGSVDEEYDAMFHNMSTIREKVNSDEEPEEDDHDVGNVKAKAGSKRKVKSKGTKTVKKKS